MTARTQHGAAHGGTLSLQRPSATEIARRAVSAVRQRPASAASTLILVAIGAIAAFAPLLPIADPDGQMLVDRLQPPLSRGESGTFHVAGTDQLGRDVLSRTIHGARISIGIAAATAMIAGTIGATAGLVAGFRGGIVDQAIMRLVDLQMAFPGLLLAIFLLYLLGSDLVNLVALLVVFSWASFARMARAETLSIKHQPFVEGAVAIGARTPRILFRHILPHLLPVLATVAVFDFAGVMLAEASLSFLGLGVQPPTPSWGLMLSQSRDHVYTGGWWLFVVPGAALFCATLCANLTSHWLQEFLGVRDR